MLAGGAVLAALLPAAAVAAPTSTEPVADAVAEARDASETPEVLGFIVQTTASARQIEATVADSLPGDVDVVDTVDGPGGVSLVQLDAPVEAEVAAEVSGRVEERGDVTFATPNYRVEAFGTPPVGTDDDLYEDQHNLWDRARSGGGYSVRAPAFWGTTRGSSSTVVAVLDTGIVAGHPDLANQLVPGYDLVTDEYVCPKGQTCRPRGSLINADDGDALDEDPSDPGDWMDASWASKCKAPKGTTSVSSWHGTHVAGIVAGQADNGVGIAGVAPGVRVQPVRVLGHCGGDVWSIMQGIYWAAGADLGAVEDGEFAGTPVNRTPAQVINLSLGSLMTTDAERREICTEAYARPLAYARSRGVTVVAAAGNDTFTKNVSANLSVPAACPGVVSVGATSRTGHRSYYSQAGSSVDISAPGGDTILDYDADRTDGRGEGGIWSSLINATKRPNTAYVSRQYEGTSMAAPHVAAAAALLYSQGATSASTVEQVLKRSVTRFPARSSRYAAYTVTDGRKNNRLYDLNCTTTRCGAGILNIARFNTGTGGTATVGRTVSAEGWQTSRADVTYEWFATDDPTVVIGTGRTLVVPTALLGRTLSVRLVVPGQADAVVETPTIGRSTSATATSLPKSVSRTKRATLKVSVSAPVPVTGTVQVFDGRKRLTARTLSKGKVTVLLPRLKKGRHSIKVVYSGSTLLTGSTSTRTLTSK
jgi:serine protease